jgi:hypothetical protein
MEIDNEHGGGICKQLPLDGISGQGVFYTVNYHSMHFWSVQNLQHFET